MEAECGSTKKEILTWESGSKAQLQVLEFLLKLRPADTRELSRVLSKMAKEPKNSLREIFIRDTIKMESFMVLESSFGKTVVFTKESFDRAKSMGMECGKKETATKNMKASLRKIENKDMEYTLGPTETSIKEITMLTSDTVLDKCTGTIALFIRDPGLSTNLMEKELFLMVSNSSTEFSKTGK